MQTNVDANPGTISSYLSLIAASACWGLATVMSKGSLEHFPPFTLLTVQLFGSTLFLWFMFFAFGMGNPLAHFKLRAAAAGLLEPGLAYALAIPGLALTSAANTSIIGASESLLIILIAWLLFMQRPSVPVIAASALALAGVLFVTMSDTSGLGQGRVLGDALVFGGMVVAALYVVLSSRLVGDVAPLPLAAQQQTVALVFAVGLALFVVLNGWEAVPQSLPLPVLLFAVASGIVQYALAFWFYLKGMQTVPVSTAGLFLALIPVFGLGGAAAFLGEPISIQQILGAAAVIAALIIAARKS